MKELILLMLFGRSVDLTPTPVSIGPACVQLTPDKSLRVINEGASLEIILPANTNGLPVTVNAASAPQQMDIRFPVGFVSATLSRDDGTQVHAINASTGSTEKGYLLLLYPEAAGSFKGVVSTYTRGDKFKSVSICAKSVITNAHVSWQTASE